MLHRSRAFEAAPQLHNKVVNLTVAFGARGLCPRRYVVCLSFDDSNRIISDAEKCATSGVDIRSDWSLFGSDPDSA